MIDLGMRRKERMISSKLRWRNCRNLAETGTERWRHQERFYCLPPVVAAYFSS